MTEIRQSVQSGLQRLGEFSSLLSTAISALDNKTEKTSDNVDAATKRISDTEEKILLHEMRLRKLEVESDEQRASVEASVLMVAGIQKSVGNQLNDATRLMHKELVTQRANTKMDISSLRGTMQSNMADALSSISFSNSKGVDLTSVPQEQASQMILDKVHVLEEAVQLQHQVNQSISATYAQSDVVQRVYDSLFEEMQQVKQELVREKDRRSVLENELEVMRSKQVIQDQKIQQLLDSMKNRDKERHTRLRAELQRVSFVPSSEPSAVIESIPQTTVEKLEQQEDNNLPITKEDDADSQFSAANSVSVEIIEQISREREARVLCETEVRQAVERLDEVEGTISTLKRVAYAVDDIKVQLEGMRARVDAHSGALDIETLLDIRRFSRLEVMRQRWSTVHAELSFSLDNLFESGENSSNGSFDKIFFKHSKEFLSLLETSLLDLQPRDNWKSTAEKMLPVLESLHVQAEKLLIEDNSARQAGSLDYCLDDLLCTDGMPGLQKLIQDAANSDLPLLDESISIYSLRSRGDALSYQLTQKAEYSLVQQMDSDLRHNLSGKLDTSEFKTMSGRFASNAELQRVLGMLGDLGGRTAGISSKEEARESVEESAAFKELVSRFDALTHTLFDLRDSSERLVGRDEIQEALRAVVGEIKTLRRTCVPHGVFMEGMKSKADAKELERVVKSLAQVLGDINLTSQDLSLSVAAQHSKCLVCDKPVTSQRNRLNNNSNKLINNSRSLPTLGYDKQSDDYHNANRSTSPTNTASKNKAKLASEVSILRTTIEPLPEITDSITESPRGDSSLGPHQNLSGDGGLGSVSFKQRIRSSAGGGMGPSFRMDTR